MRSDTKGSDMSKTHIGDLRGRIYVEGVDGWFQVTRVGVFGRVQHCVKTAENPYGYRSELVGNVPYGNYGEPARGIEPCGNPEFGNMVDQAIARYVDTLRVYRGDIGVDVPVHLRNANLRAVAEWMNNNG